MKPPRFDYAAPKALPEALAALGEGTSVLAGGQSLVLEMHYRRARPSRIVDINGIGELDHLTDDGDALRVGALARHRAFESPVTTGPLGRLLARIAPNIAHPPIRARGTMLGSLAWANPASEWPALAVALGARMRLASVAGFRSVLAEDFFLGPFTTARRPDELLVEAVLPAPLGEVGFAEHRRTHASFAQVAVVTALTVRDGVIADARLALAGMADRPIRARTAEQHLLGREATTEVFQQAGELAAADADPVPEPYGSVEHKRRVAAVLVRRTLHEAHEERA